MGVLADVSRPPKPGGTPVTTFYIVDKATGEIVNAVETTDQQSAERVLDGFIAPETLLVTRKPSSAALRNYRWEHERP